MMKTQVLFNKMLEQVGISNVSNILEVSRGTVQRWIDKDIIPERYIFDICRYLGEDVDYSKFNSTIKDQFFTPSDISKHCFEKFKEIVPEFKNYTFIEPSSGDGSFLNVLPEGTIAMDIEPRSESIMKCDYLLWKPPDNDKKKYIVFGNPPFGLRGHLALKFINHSYEFADYVCFILPQLFESDGKGSPMKRVKGYNLIHSEKLSGEYNVPEGNPVMINGVFQIWSKLSSNSKYDITSIESSVVKVYSLSDGGTPSTTRNKKMLDKCHVYLPSTCFGKENMRVYDNFVELPGKKGYGLVFLKNERKMVKSSKEIDWSSIAFLSTNSAYNIRTSIIYKYFNNKNI